VTPADATCWTLIHAAAADDGPARDHFARLYEPIARAYFTTRWQRSPVLPSLDDAVQDVFVECFKSQGVLNKVTDVPPNSFRIFFHGVLRNIARRHVRWDAGGGDSCVRFRSATESLREWQSILARCTFTCMDAFHFLDQVKDADGHGLYCDPPWPTDRFAYKHKFTEKDQRRLASKLSTYQKTKVVLRYGDHPLIRELYQPPHWTWREVTGRMQTNEAKREVLLMNWNC
jgi:DNA-directed RNA polymerase specialized sigma24 family protein